MRWVDQVRPSFGKLDVCTRLVLPIGPCHQTRLEKENARPVTFDAKRGCVPARVGDVDPLAGSREGHVELPSVFEPAGVW